MRIRADVNERNCFISEIVWKPSGLKDSDGGPVGADGKFGDGFRRSFSVKVYYLRTADASFGRKVSIERHVVVVVVAGGGGGGGIYL